MFVCLVHWHYWVSERVRFNIVINTLSVVSETRVELCLLQQTLIHPGWPIPHFAHIGCLLWSGMCSYMRLMVLMSTLKMPLTLLRQISVWVWLCCFKNCLAVWKVFYLEHRYVYYHIKYARFKHFKCHQSIGFRLFCYLYFRCKNAVFKMFPIINYNYADNLYIQQ